MLTNDEKCERDPRCGEDIESSLIRAVQRIPQYNMLLEAFMKATSFLLTQIGHH